MELILSWQLRAAACAWFGLAIIVSKSLQEAAHAGSCHDGDIQFHLHLQHHQAGDVPDSAQHNAFLKEPLTPTYNSRPAANATVIATDGEYAKIVGHATGLYLSRARPPLRVGLLYLTAVLSSSADGHNCSSITNCVAAGSLTLMGSLAAAPSGHVCSGSSSSAAADSPPQHRRELAQLELEQYGALAVVGGTGGFALARGEACVRATYTHLEPSTTLSFYLRLVANES